MAGLPAASAKKTKGCLPTRRQGRPDIECAAAVRPLACGLAGGGMPPAGSAGGMGVFCRVRMGNGTFAQPKANDGPSSTAKSTGAFLSYKNTCDKRARILSTVPACHSRAICCRTIMGFLDAWFSTPILASERKKEPTECTIAYEPLMKSERFIRGTSPDGAAPCGG